MKTRKPLLRRHHRRALATFVLASGLLAVVAGCASTSTHAPGAAPTRSVVPSGSASGTPTPTPTATPAGFDKTAHSVDDPASIWVVVNKSRGLQPLNYTPTDLVYPAVSFVNHQPVHKLTAVALEQMLHAADIEAGLKFALQSGYRSFQTQTDVYNQDAAQNGAAAADTDTARPGHSEHQTGFAVDLSPDPSKCALDACMAGTPHGKWLAENAWRFGFLLRYPADKVAVTGFTFEPWHFRYVGKELAAEMHRTGVRTLEEFFGLPGGTTYP